MKLDRLDDASIRQLVDAFYVRVRDDEALSPIFTLAIGTTDAEWAPHLAIMYDFWSSVMLTTGRYHGNPMKKHKDLPAFDAALFDRWLELFEATAREIHTAEIAQIYVEKSRRIAESLKLGLYYKPGDFSLSPSPPSSSN